MHARFAENVFLLPEKLDFQDKSMFTFENAFRNFEVTSPEFQSPQNRELTLRIASLISGESAGADGAQPGASTYFGVSQTSESSARLRRSKNGRPRTDFILLCGNGPRLTTCFFFFFSPRDPAYWDSGLESTHRMPISRPPSG